jgi:maltose O-acetyltransferase
MRKLAARILGTLKHLLRGDVPTETLIQMGLTVGKNFNRRERCIIDFSHCWLIEIGDNVTFAPNVVILAHDASTKNLIGYTRIGRVTIGDNVFIGAGSIVLPNVTIGDNVVIGAGSIVSHNIPSNSVAVGNPCKVTGDITDFISKNEKLLKENPVFEKEYTLTGKISTQMKDEMLEKLLNTVGYIR